MYLTPGDTAGHRVFASAFFVHQARELAFAVYGWQSHGPKNDQCEDITGKKYKMEPNNRG